MSPTRDTFASPRSIFFALDSVQVDHTHRWRIDANALLKAARFLGLRWPTTIRGAAAEELGALACYSGVLPRWPGRDVYRTDRHHFIYINPGIVDAAWASACLWHELTHAKQAEAYPSPAWWTTRLQRSYPKYGARIGPAYYDHPIERPAMLAMMNHFDVAALTRPGRFIGVTA